VAVFVEMYKWRQQQPAYMNMNNNIIDCLCMYRRLQC